MFCTILKASKLMSLYAVRKKKIHIERVQKLIRTMANSYWISNKACEFNTLRHSMVRWSEWKNRLLTWEVIEIEYHEPRSHTRGMQIPGGGKQRSVILSSVFI